MKEGILMTTIDRMTIADYDDAFDVWIHTPGMGLNTTDDGREGIARFLARNPATCFVARDGQTVVGTILAGYDGRRGYIYHTAVRPAYRGQGIARALVDAAMRALEAEGATKVALVAFRRNEEGNAFWERIGFTTREDLHYRNKNIQELIWIDP